MVVGSMTKNPESSLPPGYRFYPTDEELILHYLRNKANSTPYPMSIIAEVDIYKFDPWELPAKAAFGEKEWYFFSPRDRKYPNGARPNRAASSGYWKATGTDKPIVGISAAGGNQNIGVKKALVFYKGRPPKGIKTNWIMHEYRLAQAPNDNKPVTKFKDSSMRLDDWVLCRIYKKSNSIQTPTRIMDVKQEEGPSVQDVLLPTLPNFPTQNSLLTQKSSSFSNLFDAMDYYTLTRLLSDDMTGPELGHPVLSYGNPDEPIFHNYNNNSSSYLLQKLPQLDSSASFKENKLKRQSSAGTVNMDDGILPPSKKLGNPFGFTNSTTQLDTAQYHFFNQPPSFNQQFMLSSHLQTERWKNGRNEE